MKTSAGVEMSPRGERVYTFIQKHGVHLHSFSTDQDVEMHYKALEVIFDILVKLPAEVMNKGRTYTEQELRDMETDMQAIMRRRPNARVGHVY